MTEFRRDPITGRWVIVVPGRASRPNEHAAAPPTHSAAPDCPFCEGHETRTPPELAAFGTPGRLANERGWTVRTIPNRFPTVALDAPTPGSRSEPTTFESRRGVGYHEVIIESPTHSPLLPSLPPDQIGRVLRMCRDRVRAASERKDVGSITLFENSGPDSGGSLWHPHAQLVATPGVSPALEQEMAGARRYRERTGGACAFEQVGRAEASEGARVVFDSGGYLAFTPFASAFPFEVRLLPARHAPTFANATDDELTGLADHLPRLLRALLEVAPGASYNLIVRSPAEAVADFDRYHWHLDLYPRLVLPDGFDLGSGFHVNPVSPEGAADALRAALGAKR